jgi:hypothetical protein
MPIPKPESPQEQSNPFLPPGPEPLICEDFQGINTSTTRVGVDDKQMFWCSGYFPIAPHQLRTLPGIGPVLWTPNLSTILFYGFANIGVSPVAIVFLADGSIWQVRTDTGAVTNIAGASTIQNPSVLTTGMSQWGNQYVLIVNKQTNGYFIWDGTLLYLAGTLAPGVTLTNVGLNYTSAPTVTISGGHGTGATAVATINLVQAVSSITVTSDAGPNFNRIEIGPPGTPITGSITITGGGGTGATGTPNFQFLGGGGAGGDIYQVSSITMTNGGSGYTGTPTVTFSSNGSTAPGIDNTGPPILTPIIATVSPVTAVTITNPGTGFLVGDTPSVGFSGGGGTGAAATVTIMPFGVGGTGVETAFQRVWIINGPLLQFTGPGSVFNFATSIGGGSVTSNDSFLRVGYTWLKQTNGFLYLGGDSSLNYISGVQTTGSPPTTTYTNQNADPEVGTPYPMTAAVFGRNLVFANSFGVHVSYGAAVTKISEALDGVYNTVPNFGGQLPSAAKATIFGKKTWMLLLPVVDPVTGGTVNELFMWDGGKKWWSSKQDRALTFINFQEINSVLTAWGTDGSALFPLFQTASVSFTKTMQTKLWMKPGGYQFDKTNVRFWGMVQYYGSGSQNFNITIDSEYSTQPYVLSPPDVGMVWTEEGITPMTWTTDGVTPMTWSLGPIGIRVFDPQGVGQHGVLSGFTASTNAADAAIISMMIQPEVVGYRG